MESSEFSTVQGPSLGKKGPQHEGQSHAFLTDGTIVGQIRGQSYLQILDLTILDDLLILERILPFAVRLLLSFWVQRTSV